jgi:phosphoglycerate dehydrogenase-like enzyme
MTIKRKAVFFNEKADESRDYVFAKGRLEQLKEIVDLYPETVSKSNFEQHVDKLQDVEVIFSTWGMSPLSEEQISRMPDLKAVFYAAGATDSFARPFLHKGITLCSSWLANAIPVAEFCVAQILLALKGYFRNTVDCNTPGNWANGKVYKGKGIYEETVALIGAGAIARKTQKLLEPYNVEVIIIPSRPERRTVSFEEAFKKAYVISNHLPNRNDNIGCLNGELFKSMQYGATFINTGRGAQVNEQELAYVLRERPDLTALLDVTFPEPPLPDSPFYELPNVHLSSHLAGSINNEVVRMADYMLEEYKRWDKGEELKYQVSEDMLLSS